MNTTSCKHNHKTRPRHKLNSKISGETDELRVEHQERRVVQQEPSPEKQEPWLRRSASFYKFDP